MKLKNLRRWGSLFSVATLTALSAAACGGGNGLSNPATYLGDVWNTQSAEKNAMSLTQYKSAEYLFEKMATQENAQLDKVTVPGVTRKTFTITTTKESESATAELSSAESPQQPSTTSTANPYVTVSNADTNKFIPAVFMDLDETVLNNYNYQNYNLLNNKTYSPASWDKYVNDKVSTEIKGAFDFIRFVWDHGGAVFYNSNRTQDTQLKATVENLVALGLEEKYLPNWTFWMQGVDITQTQPWAHIAKKEVDGKQKLQSSTKEDRMNYFNTHTLDLNTPASKPDLLGKTITGNGTAVQFKTVMRFGDNFDDFNDNGSKDKTNADRIKMLEKTGKLFGNFDTKVKGVKYDTKGGEASAETWSESYVQIGGNTAYGSFEPGMATDPKTYYGKSDADKVADAQKVLKSWIWTPSK